MNSQKELLCYIRTNKKFFYGTLRDEMEIPQVKVMLIEDFPRD